MKKILALLLVLLLGCDDQGPQSSTEKSRYYINITSNYTSPVDVSFQSYEPVDFDNHKCDTLPAIYYTPLQSDDPPIAIIMDVEHCVKDFFDYCV